MKNIALYFGMNEWFRRLSVGVSTVAGKPIVFFSAVGIIILWLCTGSLFNFSDTWQLFINTTTTIITFLMVFLIQNTQNRDSKALQLKLDELIKVHKLARNLFVNAEELPDDELERLQKEAEKLHNQYSAALKKRLGK